MFNDLPFFVEIFDAGLRAARQNTGEQVTGPMSVMFMHGKKICTLLIKLLHIELAPPPSLHLSASYSTVI